MKKKVLSLVLASALMISLVPMQTLASEPVEETEVMEDADVEVVESKEETEGVEEGEVTADTEDTQSTRTNHVRRGYKGDVMWAIYADGTLKISPTGDTNRMGDFKAYYDNEAWRGYDAVEITKIVIEAGVKDIGDRAFEGYDKVTEVTIPDSVERVGEDAFSGCTSLATINFSGNVQSVEKNAVANTAAYNNQKSNDYIICGKVLIKSNKASYTDCRIPSGITCIADEAFSATTISGSLNLFDVKYIGANAFTAKNGIKTVDLSKVTVIGKSAFSGCSSLATVTLSSTLTYVSATSFANTPYLNTLNSNSTDGYVYVNDVLLNITNKAVLGDRVTIKDGVRVIAADIFVNAAAGAVTELYIPESVKSIGDPALSTLTDVFYAGNEAAWGNVDTNKNYDDSYLEDVYMNYLKDSSGKSTTDLFLSSNIVRYWGADRYVTSMSAADAVKKSMGVSEFKAIIVAYGKNYPDALAGSYLAKVKKAPILLVESKTETEIKTYIADNLRSDGIVYILGGTNAVSANFQTLLKKEGIKTKRISGADRYATNIAILNEAGVSNQDILVCSGTSFPDSLSASAVGLPILLVGKTMTSTQTSYLNKIKCSNVYIVGGESAVSSAVKTSLSAKGCNIQRFAGANRYETSYLVAKKFFKTSNDVVLAYAKNFPDGLSGGPLALSLNSPMILADSSNTAYANAYVKSAGVTKAAVLGGTGLISDSAVSKILKK